jgi:GntR family transcriptional regulator
VASQVTSNLPGVKAAAARRVRDSLRDEIQWSKFKDGLLPSEAALMARENASRTAVRMALNLLRSEGLVRRLQGRGTLVDGCGKVVLSLDRARSATSAVSGGSARVHYESLSMLVTEPSSGIADRLELSPVDEVLFMERLTVLDGRPLSLSSVWIPAAFAAPLIAGTADLQHGVVDLLRRECGLELGISQYGIEATAADEAVAGLLSVPTASPLLLLVALNHLSGGQPVALSYIRGRADRVRYEIPGVMPPPASAPSSVNS